jgi:hypothetical protein
MRGRRAVTTAEIAQLLAFGERLRRRGEDATCAEWIAYLEAKADVFDRIADDPATLSDRDTARQGAHKARDEAERLRAEAADWRWW